jgi:L-asparaginase
MQALSASFSEIKPQKLAVLGTGGTIAGTARVAADSAPEVDGNLAYTAAQLGVQALLQALPDRESLSFDLVAEQVAQRDSKDMDFEDWRVLALRVRHHLQQSDVAGVVITHGTDTLEETAFFLLQVLPAELLQAKPVVITCAMRPATSPEADGPQNLQDALTLAGTPAAQGLMVVCAGQIHAALKVQKVHPYRLNAFDSGDAAILGQLQGGVVTWTTPMAPMATAAILPSEASAASEASEAAPPLAANSNLQLDDLTAATVWPRVEIVMSYAGAAAFLVDALLANPNPSDLKDSQASPLRGIVVAGTGNGSVHHALEAALERAQSAGVRVWRSTRCAYGAVQAVPGKLLPEVTALAPPKARIALMLAVLQLDLKPR